MSFFVLEDQQVTIERPNAADSCMYGVDFAARIASGDSAVSATATPLETGITVGPASLIVNPYVTPTPASATACSARISGAASGTTLAVLFSISTVGGDTFNRTVWFQTL